MTTFPRIFTIHIEGCKDLLDRDGFGKGLSDPYVIVTHNKQQKHKTTTVDNTLDPTWTEKDGSFAVTMDYKDSAVLLFAVWEEDTASDEFLGHALLNMGEASLAGSTVLTLKQREPEPDDEVIKAKGMLGTIRLKWTSVAVAVPPTPKPTKTVESGLVLPGVLALRIVRAAGLGAAAASASVSIDVMYRDALVHTLPNRLEMVNPEWDDDDGLVSIPMRKTPTLVTMKIIVVKKAVRSLLGIVSIDPARVGQVGVLELPVMDPVGGNAVGGTVTLRWKFTKDVTPLAFFSGSLALTVVSGTGLLNVDEPPEISDPFVVISKGDTKLFTTRYLDNTLTPVWNETAPPIRVEGPQDLLFDVACWHKEKIGIDQFMGCGVLEIVGGKGSTQVTLTQRNPEKNRLILSAKGKLGAITVSWVYTSSVEPVVPKVPKAPPTVDVPYPVSYTITVVKANGLMDKDSILGGDSDPYVQMYHKRVKILETPVVNNNGNPVWAAGEATGTVTVGTHDEAVVTFMVWDKDTVTDEFLGMVNFNTAGLADHGTVQLALVPRPGETEKDILDMKGNLGKLTLSWVKKAQAAPRSVVVKAKANPVEANIQPKAAGPSPSAAQQTSHPVEYAITVVRAKGLLNRDSRISGVSDPYVKMFQNKEKRLQTPAVKDNLNPEWDATGNVTVTSVHDSIVNFTVWDEDTMNDEFLGTADLNTAGLAEYGTVELALTQRPGESDKEILAANGKLGTLVVSWKCSGSVAKHAALPGSASRPFKYPSTLTVAVTRAILLPPGQQLTVTIVKPSTGKTLLRSGLAHDEVFENVRKTIEMHGPEDAVVELCVLSRHAWDPEVPVGYATVDFARMGLAGTSEVALHTTRGGAPHPTMKVGIRWTVVEVTSASSVRAVAVVDRMRPPGVLMLRVESAKDILARSTPGHGTAVMVVSYDGRDVFRASAHETSTTCPAWSRKDGTCEIRLTASAEPVLRIRLVTGHGPERFLGHCALDARDLAVRGDDDIALCDRGREETEKDVMAAKGSLGTIRLAWKFTEGGTAPVSPFTQFTEGGGLPATMRLHVARVSGVSYLWPNASLHVDVRGPTPMASLPRKCVEGLTWSSQEGTREIHIAGKKCEVTFQVVTSHDGNVIGTVTMDVAACPPKGRMSLALAVPPNNRSNYPDQRGTLDVEWETECDESRSLAAPKKNELRLEVREVTRLMANDLMSVEVVVGSKTERSRQGSVDSTVTVFLGSMFAFPVVTPSHSLTLRVVCNDRVVGEGTLDVAPPKKGKEAHDGDVTLSIKGGIMNKEVCAVTLRWRYDYEDMPPPLALPPTLSLGPQRGALLLEVREFVNNKKESGAITAHYGVSTAVVNRTAILTVVPLGAATPCGVLRLVAKCGEGKVDIAQDQEGVVATRTEGEGWVPLAAGRAYIRWALCFNIMLLPVMDTEHEIELEVRSGRGLPDDLAVCMAVVPVTADRKPKAAKPWTTRASSKNTNDMDWAPDNRTGLNMCGAAEIVLQRARDGANLASAKIVFTQNVQSWEGWVALRRGGTLGEVYVRWIRNVLTQNTRVKRKAPLRHSHRETIIYVTIVSGHDAIDTVPFDAASPVEDMKPVLEQYTSVPIAQQVLYLSTQPNAALRGDRALCECLPEGASACKIIVRASRGNITLRVTVPGGKTVFVTVQESEECGAIKKALVLEGAVAAQTKRMRLTVAGQEMSDELPVSYYRLKPMTTLTLSTAALNVTDSSPWGTREWANGPHVASPHSADTTTHEIAELTAKLRDSERRAREAEDLARRALERVADLEGALSRSHALMDKALMDGASSPLRGSRRPNSTGGSSAYY